MRILFLTAQLPEPPHAGGTLRTNGLMRGIHAAGHEVHLMTFADPARLATSQAALSQFCASVEAVPPPRRTLVGRLQDLLLTRQADMQRRFYSPEFAARLERLLVAQAFDLIQIESLEMAVYLPVLRRACPHTPVIYDSFNAEYDLQRTIYEAEKHDLRRLPGAAYSFIQWRRLTQFERAVCQTVTHTSAVSEADAEAFQRLAPGIAVSVVPNGIDAAQYSHHDTSLDLGPHALVFTGSMSYRPNVDAALWFAEQVLQPIRAHVPDARFFIVGSEPHPRLDTLRGADNVEITGWVPDVNPFLHTAAVYVVPLRMGSGTRLKLLQAMAAGQAVVSTSIGAQGLDVRNGVELRLADSAAAFADAVVDLLKHPDKRQSLGETGAEYVRTHHDWKVIVPRLLAVYDQIGSAKEKEEPAHEQKTTDPA
jgi:polysaccharide biosynthesis protein PslH